MGVQDRDWYHEDRAKKERTQKPERDPRETEYHPKQFRGSAKRTNESPSQGTHWLVQLVWWIVAGFALWLAYLYVRALT